MALKRPPLWRRAHRVLTVACVFCAAIAALSWLPAVTAEPPEPLEARGPGEVPSSMRGRLVATFNGGFPLETSNAGLIYRGKVKEAMVNGIATVVGYRGGGFDIVKWESGTNVPANVWFAKQNLPPIIAGAVRAIELDINERDFFAVYLRKRQSW